MNCGNDGISIPASYCSYIAPLSSAKIYSRVMELGKFETPYVVMIHAAEIISQPFGPSNEIGQVQEAWSFEHPRTDLIFSHETGVPITNFHNARSTHLTFHIPQPSICHGFAGYFRAVLYDDVIIETHPESRMSREMLSWFPIFFPFKEPMYCPKHSELDIHLWRLTDQVGRKVWYEWSVEGFLSCPSAVKRSNDHEVDIRAMMITPPSSSSASSSSRKLKMMKQNADQNLPNEYHLTPDRIQRSLYSSSDSSQVSTQATMGDEESLVINEPIRDGSESETGSEFNLVEHLESRLRIATSSLHNVLGREASVKW